LTLFCSTTCYLEHSLCGKDECWYQDLMICTTYHQVRDEESRLQNGH
jgi:hypothetical protein